MKEIGYDFAAIGGSVLGFSVPRMDFLKDGVSVCAGICGIIFVIVSIRHKLLEIKKMKKDVGIKRVDEEDRTNASID